MDKQLNLLFTRLERALSTFVDSVVKNNASPTAANELVKADAELQTGLKTLEQHQRNWARIDQLRNETSALDEKIKGVISTLWETRKELVATSVTTYPPNALHYDFTVEELLDFARRIAPHSMPPPQLFKAKDSNVVNAVTAWPSAVEGTDGRPFNETSAAPTPTPNASFNGFATPAGVPTPSANGENPHDQPATQAITTAAAANDLPHQAKTKPSPYLPWPSQEEIRQSSLSVLQGLIDRGIDPKNHNQQEEERKRQEADQQRKDQEEQQRLAREEQERRMREEHERLLRDREKAREAETDNPRSRSVAGVATAGASRGQFQFIGAMGDDEDDD